MAAKAEWIGLKEANRALKRLPEHAKLAAQQEMDVTAFQVWRGATIRAPFLTGLLKSKLGWESRPRSVSAVVGVAPGEAFYWKFLEYGTEKMGARPFMRPAAESMRDDHDRRLIRALGKAADTVEAEAK